MTFSARCKLERGHDGEHSFSGVLKDRHDLADVLSQRDTLRADLAEAVRFLQGLTGDNINGLGYTSVVNARAFLTRLTASGKDGN
jgi:hypothetical protein